MRLHGGLVSDLRCAPAHPRAPRPGTDRSFAIAAALALLAFGANMAGPLYPGYQARLGFDDLTLTLVYASYSIASVPALLLLGPLGDRLGRVRLVRAGLLVGALGSVCFAVGDHTAWLLAGRVLQGVALGAATGAGMAVLAEAPTTRSRRRVGAVGSLAFLAGTAAGPGLTGLLADLVPAPYLVAHLLHAAALLVVLRGLGPAPAPRPAAPLGHRIAPPSPARRSRAYLAAMVTGFVSWAVVGLFLGLVPSVLARASGDVGGTALGAVASVVVLASVPAQFVLSRLGTRRAQRCGLALLAAGSLVLATTGTSPSVPVLLATAVVAGFGHGLAYGGAHGAVEAEAVGPRAAGTTATAYVVYFLGAGIPTLAVGVLSSSLTLGAATSLLAAVLLVGAVAGAVLVGSARSGGPRRHDPDDDPWGDLVALVVGGLRGVHQANGIWHGRLR